MASKYAGYMGKVIMVDLSTETVSEYPWTDEQRELYLGGNVKEVLQDLMMQGISQKELNGCTILINGKPGNKRSKLRDGDVVQLLSPVAGG